MQFLATNRRHLPTHIDMGTIRLLERLGFVRLRDFGLDLTRDRRVVSTRGKLLDDGYGTCIVGWTDGDLATMELSPWGAERPAPRRITPPPPRPAPPPPPVKRKAAAMIVPDVAAPEDEDDWEWEIAVARARASQEMPAVEIENVVTTVRPLDSYARFSEQLLGDDKRPSTVIPVPAMPKIDPQLVRSYEPPRRFPRASERRIPGALPPPPRSHTRR